MRVRPARRLAITLSAADVVTVGACGPAPPATGSSPSRTRANTIRFYNDSAFAPDLDRVSVN